MKVPRRVFTPGLIVLVPLVERQLRDGIGCFGAAAGDCLGVLHCRGSSRSSPSDYRLEACS